MTTQFARSVSRSGVVRSVDAAAQVIVFRLPTTHPGVPRTIKISRRPWKPDVRAEDAYGQPLEATVRWHWFRRIIVVTNADHTIATVFDPRTRSMDVYTPRSASSGAPADWHQDVRIRVSPNGAIRVQHDLAGHGAQTRHMVDAKVSRSGRFQAHEIRDLQSRLETIRLRGRVVKTTLQNPDRLFHQLEVERPSGRVDNVPLLVDPTLVFGSKVVWRNGPATARAI